MPGSPTDLPSPVGESGIPRGRVVECSPCPPGYDRDEPRVGRIRPPRPSGGKCRFSRSCFCARHYSSGLAAEATTPAAPALGTTLHRHRGTCTGYCRTLRPESEDHDAEGLGSPGSGGRRRRHGGHAAPEPWRQSPPPSVKDAQSASGDETHCDWRRGIGSHCDVERVQ